MSVQKLRRGLPRIAGGDPWPPADVAGSVDDAAAPIVESAQETARPASATPAAESEQQAAPATTSAASGSQSGAGADAASLGGGVLIRRGLPRVAGGDPWPPADTAAATSGVSTMNGEPAPRDAVADSATTDGSTTDTVTVQGGAAATTATTSLDTASPPASATPTVVTPPASVSKEEGIAVRRGLPRTSDGDPWPPEGTVGIPHASPVDAAPATSPTEARHAAAPDQAVASPAHAIAVDAAAPAPPVAVATPVARAPRPPLSRVAQATRDRAGSPGTKAEPEARPWWKLQWHHAIAGLLGLAALGILALLAVFVVRGVLSTGPMQDFLATYPGHYDLPEGTDEGFPAWARWQHFLNMFFIVLIIRSGMQVRHQQKPPAFWASKRGQKISINLWLHQSLDILWLINGVVFVVLLFTTGHWGRIVPTSWEVFPNALSTALQYVSLDWPTENGWVNYNALQQLSYFVIVFLAAPLAAITGVRLSGIWSKNATTLNKLYPVELARAIHFPTMLFFVLFVIGHVGLVFATGALRNLNHMYAGQDVVNWAGFGIFALSIVAVIAAWIAARPLILAPIASLVGRVSER